MLESIDFNKHCIALMESSNLPGPRANLEAMHSFARLIDALERTDEIFNALMEMWNVSSDGNDPELLVVVSGLLGLSRYYFIDSYQEGVMTVLKDAMNDSRWRVREIIQEALLYIAQTDYYELVKIYEQFSDPNYLEVRAMITTLAHPIILKEPFQTNYALNYLKRSLYLYERASQETTSKNPDFDALTKGMMFAPSVIVAASPSVGFEVLEVYVNRSKSMNRILKSNLMKARLVRVDKTMCGSLIAKMDK